MGGIGRASGELTRMLTSTVERLQPDLTTPERRPCDNIPNHAPYETIYIQ